MNNSQQYITSTKGSFVSTQSEDWNKCDINLTAAKNDFEVLSYWVKEKGSKSKCTHAKYMLEANKLLHWMRRANKSLLDITRTDLFLYRDFLTSPPVELCGKKTARDDDEWKPFFTTTPSSATICQSIELIYAIFAWLKAVGYIKHNPFEKLPREDASVSYRSRSISTSAMLCVKDYLAEMPTETTQQKRRQARMQWLFHLLRLTGMRISEVQSTTMGDFVVETKNCETRIFIKVTGKGNKERIIPVVDELLDELSIYRRSLNLSLFPSRLEKMPLVCSIENGHQCEPMTRQAIHYTVKSLVDKTSTRLDELECYEDASLLRQVSAHWFRHTYATSLLDSGASLTTGRDNLGHVSIATTNLYLHSDSELRYNETTKISNKLE